MRDTLSKGTFLIANPYLNDPNFLKTVVLICEHNDDGAFGLILNRASNVNLSQIFQGDPDADRLDKKIFFGGPVDTCKLFCLHGKHDNDSHKCESVCNGVYLGSSQECLEDLLVGNNEPAGFRLYLGCACWSKGQLDDELGMNAWIVGPANSNLVFYPNPDKIWWYVSNFIDGFDPESSIEPSDPILN